MSAIAFENLTKTFSEGDESVTALDDVNLQVAAGSIYGVIGFSGAGKSTLIRMVNAIERPSAGRVVVDGQDPAQLSTKQLRAFKKRIGMVFQHFNLLDTRTVRDNIAMPLFLDGVPKRQAYARADELIPFVGLDERKFAYPAQLSGGQKQRVGIARAIARSPEILLCDEATSALDPATTRQVIELLRKINHSLGMTILVVTHEMEVIRDLCSQVAVMDNGVVVETGSVLDVFTNSRTETAARLAGGSILDAIPEKARPHLNGGPVWSIVMLEGQIRKPLVGTLVKEFGIETNILYANTQEIQQHTVGQLLLEVSADEQHLQAARQWLAGRKIVVKELH